MIECCADMVKAQQPDMTGKIPVWEHHGVKLIGTGLDYIRFCPWCGTPIGSLDAKEQAQADYVAARGAGDIDAMADAIENMGRAMAEPSDSAHMHQPLDASRIEDERLMNETSVLSEEKK